MVTLFLQRKNFGQFNMATHIGDNTTGLQNVPSGGTQDTKGFILAELIAIDQRLERMPVDFSKRLDNYNSMSNYSSMGVQY